MGSGDFVTLTGTVSTVTARKVVSIGDRRVEWEVTGEDVPSVSAGLLTLVNGDKS